MKKLVVAFLVVLMASGCQSTKKARQQQFVVGMECNYTPYNYTLNSETNTSVALDGIGFCDGYDVMIARHIANELGKELVVKKIEWDGLPIALESNEIDAIIAGMTATKEKQQGIDFTTPYYDSEMVMIVRKEDTLAQATSLQDFSNKKVVGQMSTNYDLVIDQIPNVIHQTPKASYPEMVIALQAKDCDAITAELPVAESVVAANSNLAIVHFAANKGFQIDNSVSIGFKKGSKDSDLFQKTQQILDHLSQEQRMDYMKQANQHAPVNQ